MSHNIQLFINTIMIVFLAQIYNTIGVKGFYISLDKHTVVISKGLELRYYILIWWKFYLNDFNPVFRLL